MSNHMHLVVRNEPERVKQWSDEEVAIQWLRMTSRKRCRGNSGGEPKQAEIDAIVSDAKRVATIRSRMADPSWLMRMLCQNIAIRCNAEDECTGRVFQDRFSLRKLETDEDVLTCMAYTDLNPLRAGLVDDLTSYEEVSIGERLRSLDDEQVNTADWLQPIAAEAPPASQQVNKMDAETILEKREELRRLSGSIAMSLEDYIAMLTHLALTDRSELQNHEGLQVSPLRRAPRLAGRALDLPNLHRQFKDISNACQITRSSAERQAIAARRSHPVAAQPPPAVSPR
ncbi:MAG: hypothetical protein AAFP90_00150 [Planctomycetota bacterium]